MDKFIKYLTLRQVAADVWWLLKPLRKIIKFVWEFPGVKLLCALQCLFWFFLFQGAPLSTKICEDCGEEIHTANFIHVFITCPLEKAARSLIKESTTNFNKDRDPGICTRLDRYPAHLDEVSLSNCNKLHRIHLYKGNWNMYAVQHPRGKYLEYKNKIEYEFKKNIGCRSHI